MSINKKQVRNSEKKSYIATIFGYIANFFRSVGAILGIYTEKQLNKLKNEHKEELANLEKEYKEELANLKEEYEKYEKEMAYLKEKYEKLENIDKEHLRNSEELAEKYYSELNNSKRNYDELSDLMIYNGNLLKKYTDIFGKRENDLEEGVVRDRINKLVNRHVSRKEGEIKDLNIIIENLKNDLTKLKEEESQHEVELQRHRSKDAIEKRSHISHKKVAEIANLRESLARERERNANLEKQLEETRLGLQKAQRENAVKSRMF